MGTSARSHLVLALLSIPTVLLSVVLLSGCSIDTGGTGERRVSGSGNVTTQTRPVAGTTMVELATVGNLEITVGDQESIRVEAEDNLLQYLQTTVSNGRLTIDTTDDVNLHPQKPIRYFLTIKSLEAVQASSSGDVKSVALTAPHLTLTISSSGNLEVAGVQADSLQVAVQSSGELMVRGGQVATETVRLSSSGNYDSGDLAATSADVELTSSGDAIVWVRDRLSGRLTSSGGLSYYGSPQVSVDQTSSGQVHSLGDK